MRIVEDMACAAVVVSATLAGLAAVAAGAHADAQTADAVALTAGTALLLALGLVALGRRRLAARAFSLDQAVLNASVAAGIIVAAVVPFMYFGLALPAAVGGVLSVGFVVGAAVGGGVANRVLRSAWMSRRLRRNVAIYGASAETLTILDAIARDENAAFAGLYEDRVAGGRAESSEFLITGMLSDLAERIARGQVDEVVVALPATAGARIQAICNRLLDLPVDVALSSGTAHDIGNMPVIAPVQIGGRTVSRIHCRPMSDWGAVSKAALDRIVAALALLALSPLMAFISLAIKLESRGPVFFRQRRRGVCGRSIVVWKFRTMRVMEDGAVVRQASKDDERITRVGRLLRRTSLDELPQLFNVIGGSMSLVGPRPHAIAHDEYYGARIPIYTRRSIVRPGITGWAQINGLRGETRTHDEMADRVKHDLWYVANWSVWLDIKILLLTPFYGLVHKNAY